MRAIAVVCASQSRVSRLSLARPVVRERVVLGAPVVLGDAPLAADQTVALEAAQGREERPGVDLEHALADLLEADADAVAVHRLQRQRLQDQHVQGALHQRRLVVGHRGSMGGRGDPAAAPFI